MLIPINVLSVFFFASILLALAPGTDNIFVLTQAAIRGRLAGFVITLGLCTGLVVHTLVVASGVAMIFQGSLIAFTALKLIGGGYLLYLSYLAFRDSATNLSPYEIRRTSLFQLYRRGIIMNITNLKVSLFFLSFLPQFADHYRGSLMLQLSILGFVFIISAMLVFCMISLFAGYLGDRLQQSPGALNIMNRIASIVYVALAVKLISAEI